SSFAHAAKGPVITKAIPKSGEKLPVVGLGTASSFASSQDVAARRDVIETLFAGGGTLIDTAPSYAQAEEVTGAILQDLKATKKTFIATKVRVEGRENGITSFKASLEKLKTDKIDLMQIHNLVDTATHLATMRDWKKQGTFRYLGITHWQPDQQEKLADVMAKEELDFVQLNYSVDVREPEKRLLPLAQERGIAVLVNVPLGRGRLLEAVKGKELPAWAKDFGCDSFAQLLLKFVVSHPAVTVAIPATSKAKHMADNIAAAYGRLPDDKERQKIAEFWANV
ncbi:MAG: aldo/keto reductase, partial [Rhodospirillaceae bacterium]|nr:aldo/keto reductase [Rhodospirillaceae bacterium]